MDRYVVFTKYEYFFFIVFLLSQSNIWKLLFEIGAMLLETDRFPTKNEYYSRAASSSAKLFPFWQTRLIPAVTSDRRPSFHQSSKQNPQLPVEEPW